ncbi:MAG: TOBE domain-containing protein [Sulfurimonadaceae bacterium]|jgi:molybdate transport system regulatory protein
MNQIAATITDIQSVDAITIVSFEAAGQAMRMMALELNDTLGVGSKVILGVKATNIALAKERVETISISNQLEVTIEGINMGALLCSVTFNFADQLWESIITRESALTMQLDVGDKIVALVKSSELSIVEIL